jgi:hypothetical protein
MTRDVSPAWHLETMARDGFDLDAAPDPEMFPGWDDGSEFVAELMNDEGRIHPLPAGHLVVGEEPCEPCPKCNDRGWYYDERVDVRRPCGICGERGNAQSS